MAMVLVARFADFTEAQVAASALRASGIPVMVQNEFHGQTMFYMSQALGGFRLWAPAEDAADARAFVAACRADVRPDDPARSGGPLMALGAVALAILSPALGWMLVPLRGRRPLADD